MTLSLRDPLIDCSCPTGTLRLSNDLLLCLDKTKGPTWSHLPCKSLLPELSVKEVWSEHQDLWLATQTATRLVFNEQTLPIPRLQRLQMLGRLSDEDRARLNRIASTFRCDGPCKGSEQIADYFWCKKCFGWQHKDCMLYGETGDKGGPVCNHCFMNFLLHFDEIKRWQRLRQLEVIHEAWNYLHDPYNQNQPWRLNIVKGILWGFMVEVRHDCVELSPKGRSPRSLEVAYPGKNNLLTLQQHRRQYLLSQGTISRSESPYTTTKTGTDYPGDPARADSVSTSATNGRVLRPRPGLESLRHASTQLPSITSHRRALEPDTSDDEAIMPRRKKILADKPSQERLRAAHLQTGRRFATEAPRQPARATSSRIASQRPESSSISTRQMTLIKDEEARRPTKRSARAQEVFEDDLIDSEPLSRPSKRARRDPQSTKEVCCSCNCSDDVIVSTADCYCCFRCNMLQHIACAASDRDIHGGSLCNLCSRPPAMNAAPSLGRPGDTDYHFALRQEIQGLCSGLLWKVWRNIPSSTPHRELHLSSQARTSAMSSPPSAWVEQATACLLTLFAAAGEETIAYYMKPAMSAWPRQETSIRIALGDLTRHVLGEEPLRSRRGELGLLLEIVGLAEKGRYCKLRTE